VQNLKPKYSLPVPYLTIAVVSVLYRLDVCENGRQKVCVRGLLEHKVHDAKSVVQVVTD